MAGVSLQPVDGRQLSIAVVSVTATSNAVVTGTVGNIIKVYKLFLVNSTATNITFQDGTTALSGALNLAINGAITLDLDGQPWFTCSSGNNFTINQSGTAQISGTVYYTTTPWAGGTL